MIVSDPRRLDGSPSARRLRRAAACAALAVASAAGVAQAAEPGIPTDIQVEAGNKLYLEAHATGVRTATSSPSARTRSPPTCAPRTTVSADGSPAASAG